MERKSDLFHEILRDFHEAGVLEDIVLIGSWCQLIYRSCYGASPFIPEVRTTDLDFMFTNPARIKGSADVPAILKKKNFRIKFDYPSGLMKFVHPDLEVEFLVPEKGRGLNGPFPVKKLKLNAQGIRMLDFLEKNLMDVEYQGMKLRVPEPEAFVLHKFLYNSRRKNPEKKEKDLVTSVSIARFLMRRSESQLRLRELFRPLPRKWKAAILKTVEPVFPALAEHLDKED